jgi:hypothetical protein
MGFIRIKNYRLGDTWVMSYNVLGLGIISIRGYLRFKVERDFRVSHKYALGRYGKMIIGFRC